MKRKIHDFVKNICIVLIYLASPISLIIRMMGVRVLDTKHDAIGHLACEPDIYLREQKLKRLNRPTILFPSYLLLRGNKFLSLNISNRYLLNCWKKYFLVIKNPILHILLYPILKSPLLQHNPDYYLAQRPLNFNQPESNGISIMNEYDKKFGEGTGYKPILKLSNKEMEKGQCLLKEMGLSSKDWFVCFNCREAGYYSDNVLNTMSVRNADIESFELAVKKIVSRGGWCIRIGSPKAKLLPLSLKNEKIIDYPHTKWVSDFMDIFLISNCRFFIGTNSGISSAAAIFGTPCVLTNVVPFGQLSMYPQDLAIFKLHRRKLDQKLLIFSQCLTSYLSVSIMTKNFEELNVEVVDNTKEEIRDVCLEMLDRLEGHCQAIPEDEVLQTKFRGFMNSFCLSYGSNARVGKDYLKKYQDLLQ